MTKRDLAYKVYDRLNENTEAGLSKKEVHDIVKNAFRLIIESLHKKEKVQISGFGTFVVKKRKSKVGRNLRTGETIKVPDRYVVLFKPSKKLVSLLSSSNKSV